MSVRKLLTPREVAALLRVHPKTVVKRANLGQLPGFRLGSEWRFDEDVLEAHIASKVASSCQPSTPSE